MENLFYIKTDGRKTDKIVECLKSHGLWTGAVECEYYEYKRIPHGLIMWCETSKYPAFVLLAQEKIIKKCGIEVKF